jgi:hypothetical protein
MDRKTIEKIIYNSGDVFLPEPVVKLLGTELLGSSKKTLYLSGWSIVHFLTGILCGYIYEYVYPDVETGRYYYKLFILHTIWELWQVLIGMAHPFNLTGSGNILDIVIDTAMFMAGAYVNRRFV